MKIDIHVHTKKCKEGDSVHRNIEVDKFDEIIRLTDVKILAVTNHNHFDLVQFQSFSDRVKDVCQLWPGIELDILEDGRRAHLIVIVNPKSVEEFSDISNQLLEGKTADNFTIAIEEVVGNYDSLDPIYIAHYHTKKPNLLDEDVQKLIKSVQNQKRVLKEATNSISAGIYISHGHNSIYGSDVHNWSDYPRLSVELPDLRLPVESFEQFCLLLEKDNATINTILDKKTKETVPLNPFGVAELIDLDIYNDINILFGSKGTGKTEILRALSKYYNDLGFKNEVYESSSQRLEEVYDLRGHSYDINASDFGLEDCVEDFRIIRNSSEKNVTSLSSYRRYFSAEETNKKSQSLKIKNFTQLDEASLERSFKEIIATLEEVKRFNDYIESDELLLEVIGTELFDELNSVINRISEKLTSESKTRVVDYRSLTLFNQLIQVFVEEISKKTGQPQKPITTGFKEYASNRIKLERSVRKILNNVSQAIDPQFEYVGDLGGKGKLDCKTNIVIQNGSFIDSSYTPIKKVNKNPQRYVSAKLDLISRHLYSNSLFEKIREFKEVEGSESITSISDLLLFKRHFVIDDNYYTPSSGESSMVLLHNELLEDKEIYIIDEPEKSLGNDYISDVIVPLLKERAQSGRKIIIATHDANIAVRTLPYNSIYREHDINGYYTYSGNPFSNNLTCPIAAKNDLDWKEISMKTLEGGKEAFGERGKIYGNT